MEIKKKLMICSAHKLNLPYESKCNRLHGHNWMIDVCLQGKKNENDMIIDFSDVKEEVMKLDHIYLNDVIKNPTAENIVDYLIEKFKDMGIFSGVKIRVEETPTNFAEDSWNCD